MAKELEEEENILRQSVDKLKSVEESRTSLVNHLKEALREQVRSFALASSTICLDISTNLASFVCQESELENLQSQIQVMIDFCYLHLEFK